MTKHILTDAQVAQILAGNTEVDLGEATPAPGVIASVPAVPLAAVAPTPAASPAAAPAAVPSTDLVAYLTGQLATKDAELISTKAELTSAKAASTVAAETSEGLVNIARAVVGQMQVALGNTDSAVRLNANDVVAEYARVLPVYKAKLPVGGVTQRGLEADSNVPDAHPRFSERLAQINAAK